MTKHTFRTPTEEITIEPIDVPPGADPQEVIMKLLHDCPECRAAMARGEQPQIVLPEEWQDAVEAGRREARAKRHQKPPRWRKRKSGRASARNGGTR